MCEDCRDWVEDNRRLRVDPLEGVPFNQRADIPLCRKLVEWVEFQDTLPEERREWYQGTWVAVRRDAFGICGTYRCAAGFIGALFEDRYLFDDVVEGVHVRDFAKSKLGLSDQEATLLFAGKNSAENIRNYLESWSGEKL